MQSTSRIAPWIALALLGALATGAAPTQAPSAPPAPAPAASTRPAAVEVLATRHDLRGPFNLGRGKARLVVFLSPTCKVCIANAARLQQVLDAAPGDDLEVHALWMKVLDTDDRASVDRAATVLRDARVHHYWDPERVLRHQLLDAIEFDVQVRVYDVFLLYDGTAMWDQRLPRPRFWMHEYQGLPGPVFDPAVFATELAAARRGDPPGKPR